MVHLCPFVFVRLFNLIWGNASCREGMVGPSPFTCFLTCLTFFFPICKMTSWHRFTVASVPHQVEKKNKKNLLVYQPFQYCFPALVLTNPYDYLGHKGWDLATGWTGCWRGGRAAVETSVVLVVGTHFRQIKTTATSFIHHCAPTKSTLSANPHDLRLTSHHF